MTLGGFVVRNTFRNKRRSMLTMLSISFSLLLLTMMMSIWRTFYIDQGPPNAAKTIITRDRVSLAFFLPAYYRDKIRAVPGVVAVAPMTYFGNVYKDDRATNSFAQVVYRSGRVPEGCAGQDSSRGPVAGVATRPHRSDGGYRTGEEVRVEDRRPSGAAESVFPGAS